MLPDALPTTQPIPLRFTGTGRAYFGIWIVNLLLSILTLGIYSAWAKVRRKKYFYQHTLLDGASFDYHARPVAILKGRLIAVALLLAYNLLAKTNPIVAALLFLLLTIAVPWLVVRSMMFNARNTSYRGLRFDFSGSSGQAAKVFIAYPMLVFMSLGLAYPWFKQRANAFLMNHHRFGTHAFSCEATAGAFYSIYLKLVAVVAGLALVLVFAAKSLLPTHLANAQSPAVQPQAEISHSQALWLTRAQAGSSLSKAEQDELARALEALQTEPPASRTPRSVLEGVLPGLIVLFTYLLMFSVFGAYLNSRISNLVWNHSHIAGARFACRQRMRDLAWLYASNLLMLIATVGLATPFAQIRMARYRLQALSVAGIYNWEQFVGEQKAALRATGEEIAEMFDVDISFG